MVKIKVTSIEPCFDSTSPMLTVGLYIEQLTTHKDTKVCNHAKVSVQIEKSNQTLDDIRKEAVATAVRFLSALSEAR